MVQQEAVSKIHGRVQSLRQEDLSGCCVAEISESIKTFPGHVAIDPRIWEVVLVQPARLRLECSIHISKKSLEGAPWTFHLDFIL